jgi:hypothetical protein
MNLDLTQFRLIDNSKNCYVLRDLGKKPSIYYHLFDANDLASAIAVGCIDNDYQSLLFVVVPGYKTNRVSIYFYEVRSTYFTLRLDLSAVCNTNEYRVYLATLQVAYVIRANGKRHDTNVCQVYQLPEVFV